jgi:predicted nucleic acid-binding protein
VNVYVESNFVLEIALAQRQSVAALAILERAENGQIELILPAYSVCEPLGRITTSARKRKAAVTEFNNHLREISRSTAHSEDVSYLASIESRFAAIERREEENLFATIGRILSISTVIPFTATSFARARDNIELLQLKPPDAIIYSMIVEDLASGRVRGPSLFISLNWKDFDTDEIRSELNGLDCDLARSFGEGEIRLDRPLPSTRGKHLQELAQSNGSYGSHPTPLSSARSPHRSRTCADPRRRELPECA